MYTYVCKHIHMCINIPFHVLLFDTNSLTHSVPLERSHVHTQLHRTKQRAQSRRRAFVFAHEPALPDTLGSSGLWQNDSRQTAALHGEWCRGGGEGRGGGLCGHTLGCQCRGGRSETGCMCARVCCGKWREEGLYCVPALLRISESLTSFCFIFYCR